MRTKAGADSRQNVISKRALHGATNLHTILDIQDRKYSVEILRTVEQPADAPRLIMVSRQHNESAATIARVCIQAVRHFTLEPHELWVVDNNSPTENVSWLREEPGINVVFNHTEPLPPEHRGKPEMETHVDRQLSLGSYANAIGLEIGVRLIDPATRLVMSLHMDTMPCRANWLRYLASHIRNDVAAAGMRMDRTRTPEGILHVLGYLVAFQLFRGLQLNFFPDLPLLDVGDAVSVKLRENGYRVFACPNTLWEPDLVNLIPDSSPLKHVSVDRSLDDQGNVIFLHLGRGVRKSIGNHLAGFGVEQWAELARELMTS